MLNKRFEDVMSILVLGILYEYDMISNGIYDTWRVTLLHRRWKRQVSVGFGQVKVVGQMDSTCQPIIIRLSPIYL